MLLALSQAKDTQPGLDRRLDRQLYARSRSLIKCRERAVGLRPLDAPLHRLLMHAKSSSHVKDRWLLPLAEQHRCPRHPVCRFGPLTATKPSVLQSPLQSSPTHPLPPSCHDALDQPLSRIRKQITRSMISFMESIVLVSPRCLSKSRKFVVVGQARLWPEYSGSGQEARRSRELKPPRHPRLTAFVITR